MTDSVKKFLALAQEDRFKGWPMVPGSLKHGDKIPFFGSTINYQLETDKGIEDYTSIIRSFGWAVVMGLTEDNEVITLIQWKPGLNRESWEFPPGGIGKLDSSATPEEIQDKTIAAFLKETGYGNGNWSSLGKVCIESGKYRGASVDDHGLYAHLFLATGLQKVADARKPEANEIMETIMVPLEEMWSVLESGLFVETSAVACAYKAMCALGFFPNTKAI